MAGRRWEDAGKLNSAVGDGKLTERRNSRDLMGSRGEGEIRSGCRAEIGRGAVERKLEAWGCGVMRNSESGGWQ